MLEIVICECVTFVLQLVKCEYSEHLRCIEIIDMGEVMCLTANNISFYYPLPCYNIGMSQFIMPKYYMLLSENIKL